ncbi:transporter, CPA2 family [Dictyocaulus viviparus]|uniref:Transporter, CPA2 family n=1 Tax=Dictyocaulus viviparus TaxID=29172 RepID=A0A0D8XNI6_DICVI|nr:transporter, CPA2 family [Dictyocaulus viviparus]
MLEEFDALVFPVLALIVGLILDEVNKLISFLGIPDSVLQFLIAMCGSTAMNAFLPAEVAINLTERYSWTSMKPETILKMMLPPLLFEASFKINAHMFFAKVYLIVSLTTVVYFETLFIASAFMLPVLVQTQKFKISAVFIFIAIIVATDPVAVVAILEQYNAPHRLRILIEGESLLNDGLALTAYSALVSILQMELDYTDYINVPELVFLLFMNVVISPIMGIIAAKTVSWIVHRLRENKKRQAFILVSVYGIFMLCDKCSGSPALGLCTFGIMLSSYRETIEPETSQVALELWATMGYWANNVIFIFAGFCVGSEIFQKKHINYKRYNNGYLEVDIADLFTFFEGILLAPIPLFARIASVYIFYKYYGMISTQPLPPWSDFALLAYSGLRGALGLILAMELRNKVKFDFLLKFCCTEITIDRNQSFQIPVEMTKKILLLTCSTTFACLVFQLYVDILYESECFIQIREALHTMRFNRSEYVVGSNWHVVKVQLTECLKKHATQMENDMMQPQDDLNPEETIGDENKDNVKNGDVVDARTGFYGILLARVHDSWAHGSISGTTAHIVIAILEHGIDEGQITAEDIEHFLGTFDLNIFEKAMFEISERLFLWICHDTWLNRFAEIGSCPLVSPTKSNNIHYAVSRPFEKFVFIFLIH